MTYRPSVRMDDAFRDYMNELFHATSLDRNQLIRAAIFTAAHSEEFRSLIGRYRRQPGVPLPFPIWRTDQHGYWMEQTFSDRVEGSGANEKERQQRPVHERKDSGGITIKFG